MNPLPLRCGHHIWMPPEDNHFSRTKCLLCSTADKRPSVQSISEPHSLFLMYFYLVGVWLFIFVSSTRGGADSAFWRNRFFRFLGQEKTRKTGFGRFFVLYTVFWHFKNRISGFLKTGSHTYLQQGVQRFVCDLTPSFLCNNGSWYPMIKVMS